MLRIFNAAASKPSSKPLTAEQLEVKSLPAVEPDADAFTVEQQKQLAPYVAKLIANLTITPVEDSNLVAISYKDLDPNMATKIADAVAYVFIKGDVKRETAGSLNASDKLASEIARLQLSIRQLEEQRINYLKNNDLPLGQAKGQNIHGRTSGHAERSVIRQRARAKILASSLRKRTKSGGHLVNSRGAGR